MDHWQSDIDHIRWLENLNITSFAGLNALDLGCGSGYLCSKMKGEGAQTVVGIDIVRPKNADGADWSFQELDLDSKDWAEGLSTKFDLILAFDIIEHLNSPYVFLQNCERLLQPNGRLVITTPNISSWERMKSPRTWSGARDEQHKTLFNRYSLSFLMQKAGLSPLAMKAPMRSLQFLGPLQPNIGGQLLALAEKS